MRPPGNGPSGSTPRPSAAPGSSRRSWPWRARARRSAGRCDSTRWSRMRSSSPAMGCAPPISRSRASSMPTLPADLGRQRPAASGAHQPDRQRAAGAVAGAAAETTAAPHAAGTGTSMRDRDRGQRPGHRRGRAARGSSSRSSPPSRRAWVPASASRSATASSPPMRAGSTCGQPARAGHARSLVPADCRSDMPAAGERSAPALASPKRAAGCSWWTTRRRSASWWPSICGVTASPSRWSPAAEPALARLRERGLRPGGERPAHAGPGRAGAGGGPARGEHPELAQARGADHRRRAGCRSSTRRSATPTLPVFEKPLDLGHCATQVRRLLVAA